MCPFSHSCTKNAEDFVRENEIGISLSPSSSQNVNKRHLTIAHSEKRFLLQVIAKLTFISQKFRSFVIIVDYLSRLVTKQRR